MFFSESSEVEIGENVAQQNQAPETILLQHAGGVAGAAALRAQMDVREDQRVVDGRIHCTIYSATMLRDDESLITMR